MKTPLSRPARRTGNIQMDGNVPDRQMTRWKCWAPQQPPTAWQHLASRPWGSKRLPSQLFSYMYMSFCAIQKNVQNQGTSCLSKSKSKHPSCSSCLLANFCMWCLWLLCCRVSFCAFCNSFVRSAAWACCRCNLRLQQNSSMKAMPCSQLTSAESVSFEGKRVDFTTNQQCKYPK